MSPAEPMPRPLTEREVEHKFRVHGLFRLPDLSRVEGVGAVHEHGTVELESRYFDTPDLRLAREGITLRRRTGDDEGWHLKVPVGPAAPTGTRDEIRLPLSAGGDAPPEQLIWIVRAIVRTSPVNLVSTLRTARSIMLIRGPQGAPIAELMDDTVHVIDTGGVTTARFRELELEERGGGWPLAAVAAALIEAGAVGGGYVAKVVRALGPAAAGPPEVPSPEPPRPALPAAETVTAYLAIQVRALRTADLEFRRNPESAGEAVHQMRVAARRLRGGLRTFQALLEPEWANRLRAELAWFARGLNDLRESEVLQSRLRAHAGDLPDEVPAAPVRDFLDAILDAEIVKARNAVVELLDSDRYLALHEALVQAVTHPALDAAASVAAQDILPGLVHDAWTRLDKPARALSAGSPAEEWHKVRLRAKRARYAAETVALALGADARTFATQMERLTDVLGEHQDAVQAADMLHRLAQQEPADPEIVFALGALVTLEHDHAHAARRRFAAIWRDARKPKWRRWLTTA